MADFHRRSGVPRATVYTWIAGTRLPDPASCDTISDALGLPLDAVLIVAGHRPNIEQINPDDQDAVRIARVIARWTPAQRKWLLDLMERTDAMLGDDDNGDDAATA